MKIIPSVNFHLWKPCNMRCKFCFATFKDVKNTILPKGHLPKEQALQVVQELIDFGFEKITFVGGEPTLCPWLFDLVKLAKSEGLTTMLVTNGSKIDSNFLKRYQGILDWITLSIDSLKVETNIMSGRAVIGKRPISADSYLHLCNQIKLYGFRLKINSVIHQLNFMENFNDFIKATQPERWKIFQVLPIKGENDAHINEFKLRKAEFDIFKSNHRLLEVDLNTTIVFENNDDMTSSYVMVDPAGRFFDNSAGKLSHSPPILEVGTMAALKSVNINYEKFIARKGIYDWK